MRTVTIADLKNNLSRYLREVRRGQHFTVLSRDVPVARLTPVESEGRLLDVRTPTSGTPRPCDAPLPEPLPPPGDIVTLLLEERGTR